MSDVIATRLEIAEGVSEVMHQRFWYIELRKLPSISNECIQGVDRFARTDRFLHSVDRVSMKRVQF